MKPIIVLVALYFIVMHYVLRDCIKEDGKEKVMDMSFNAEISRRRFVEAMGAVSALGVMGLAGCGSQRASEAGSSSSSASGVSRHHHVCSGR